MHTPMKNLPSFEDSDFFCDVTNVTMGPKIGEGMFSKVYVAKYFGDIVAVKKMIREEEKLETYVLRELAVLNYVKHDHMLDYIGASNVVTGDGHTLFIITELAEGGDLLRLLLDRTQTIGWKFVARLLKESVEGLLYMHEKNLIHRDVKSSNLLLDREWRIKIADFGLAREVAGDGVMSICGTDEYMAPELLFDEPYGIAADMFSFAMVMVEVITRTKVGFDNFVVRTPRNNFRFDFEKEVAPNILPEAPTSLVELARQLASFEPDDRPSTSDTLAWLEDLVVELPDDMVPEPRLPEHPDVPDEATRGSKDSLIESVASKDDDFSRPRAPHDDAASEGSLESGRSKEGPSGIDRSPSGSSASGAGLDPMATPKASHKSKESASASSAMQARKVKESKKRGSGDGTSLYRATGSTATVVTKSGYLYRRVRGTGFKNWRKTWFVLRGSSLSWFDNRSQATKRTSEPKGRVSLGGCVIELLSVEQLAVGSLNSTASTKSGDGSSPPSSTQALHAMAAGGASAVGGGSGGGDQDRERMLAEVREVAATNERQMMEWITALQLGIDTADAVERGRDSAALETNTHWWGSLGGGVKALNSVDDWLQALELDHLKETFRANGYDNIKLLAEMGLTGEDLDFLGIMTPIHRRVLLVAGNGHFRPTLEVSIQSYQDFGNVVVFQVVSHWRTWRSSVFFRYTDFFNLNRKLRGVAMDQAGASATLLSRLPPLPGSAGDQSPNSSMSMSGRNPAFLKGRKEELEVWLTGVCAAIGTQEPYFSAIAASLELAPWQKSTTGEGPETETEV